MRHAVGLALVFVGILGAIVGVAALAGFGPAPATPQPALENPQYDDPQLPDMAPGTAEVALDSTEPTNTILIDPNGFGTDDRDLLPLTNALTEAGHEVKIRGFDDLDEELDEIDGVITVGMSGYSEDEVEALSEFADDGGRVVFAIDPSDEFSGDLSPAEVRNAFDISVTPGYVYNLEENDLNYQRLFAEPARESAVTEGIDRVVFQTATPLTSRSTDGTLEPAAGSTLSTTREATSDPVLVHTDNVVVVGDTQFFRPENTQRGDNDVLLGNLGDFLVTGTGPETTTETTANQTETEAP